MKDFLDLVHSRKSIRTFLEKKVSRQLIEKIVAVGTYAPTNCNQQLWKVVAITSKKTKKELVEQAAGNTLLLRSPVALVITYDGWSYKESIQGTSLMVGQMLLAAEYYGLGALPINSYGSDRKVKKILGIPDEQTIGCFVLLGYPDLEAQESKLVKRKPVSEVLQYEKFVKEWSIPFTYDPNMWKLEHISQHQQYYSRKTKSGKEMDIMSEWERLVVRYSLAQLDNSSIADVFSYDGSFLSDFPSSKVTTFDLESETASYTASAVVKSVTHNKSLFSHKIYSQKSKKMDNKLYDAVTAVFKLERIPEETRVRFFDQALSSLKPNGELILVFRTNNFLLQLFFLTIKVLFGKDVRKTGIFAFFGPYQPLSSTQVIKELQLAGFSSTSKKGYFLFPAIFDRYAQMFFQYLASDGTSYLHRQKRVNIVTKLVESILKIQGIREVGQFGSVVVVRAKRN